MNIVLWILSVLVFITVVLLTILVLRKRDTSEDNQGTELLLKHINSLNESIDRRMGQSSKDVNEMISREMRESQKLVNYVQQEVSKHLMSVTKEITQASESSKQVFAIADQLRDLEKVLKHQKQRGNFGEASLELILSNMLPPEGYKKQYPLVDDTTKKPIYADAVIITKEGVIPVDAKFSLDNYNRVISESDPAKRSVLESEFKNDLKKRIDETAKYILPRQGTLPFAFMFIPAEGIYYDLLINEVGSVKVNTRNLIDYAYNDKKVIIVSPTTFSAYLHSVLFGFKAFKIEEQALEIAKKVEELARHLRAYESYHQKLGKSLETVVNHYNSTTGEFKKIDKDVSRITGVATTGLEIPKIDKPIPEEEL